MIHHWSTLRVHSRCSQSIWTRWNCCRLCVLGQSCNLFLRKKYEKDNQYTFSDYVVVSSVIGIYNGVITVTARKEGHHYVWTAKLPNEYVSDIHRLCMSHQLHDTVLHCCDRVKHHDSFADKEMRIGAEFPEKNWSVWRLLLFAFFSSSLLNLKFQMGNQIGRNNDDKHLSITAYPIVERLVDSADAYRLGS